ncbi:XdhC family protein [Marinibaculum pumilum]|uniref:XdhC family protein n=1 Tax=Marinibaculum pumilum TaxID=1766165 RepID=A0ABV7L4A1_9PROT
MSDELYDRIAALRAAGRPFCVATVVRTENATSAKAGAKAIVDTEGAIHGHVGGGCVQGALRRGAAAVLQSGTARLIRVRPREDVDGPVDSDGTELHGSACPSGGTVDLFLEPMGTAPRLVLCGASPIALALADLAPRLGYRLAVAAAEEDLAAFDRAERRQAGYDLGPLEIAAGDFLVVATQGRRDLEALAAALNSPAGHVAFVGSRRKTAALAARLRAQGVAEARIAGLRAPAGLDLQAIEPAEIALSILAEIVQLRRAGQRDRDRMARTA